MDRRLQLQTLLETLLGSRNVYFQPPTNMQMQYPCIVYNRDNVDNKRANNESYSRTKSYTVTIIDKNPDSVIPEKVADLPLCRFSAFFTADKLNHTNYKLYF